MASVAGRKKSIVSTAGLNIEPGNTLLNKAASQSTSLYQQCSSLRARLLRTYHILDDLPSPPTNNAKPLAPPPDKYDCPRRPDLRA